MTERAPPLVRRLAAVRERIADAAGAGPTPTLIGVSKRQPLSSIVAAVAAGLQDLGENYAQELRDKRRDAPDFDARWHFIGPVQSNKVKYVVGCACIHTVDRLALLEAIDKRAAQDGVQQSVLIQVNVAAETAKHGAAPHDVPALLDAFTDLTHVRCDGLMLIPPLCTPEETRPHFAALRTLRDRWSRTTRPGVELTELSMGMSADYEVAIAEGATMVRVGTAIFGPRPTG